MSNWAARTNCYAKFGCDETENLYFKIYDNTGVEVKDLLITQKNHPTYQTKCYNNGNTGIWIDQFGDIQLAGRLSFDEFFYFR